jgi:hypothetical protein
MGGINMRKLLIVILVVASIGLATHTQANTQHLSNKQIVKQELTKAGYGSQWTYVNKLVQYESGWHVNARNGRYYSLFQTTYYSKDVRKQTRHFIRYAKARYGSPKGAWTKGICVKGWY